MTVWLIWRCEERFGLLRNGADEDAADKAIGLLFTLRNGARRHGLEEERAAVGHDASIVAIDALLGEQADQLDDETANFLARLQGSGVLKETISESASAVLDFADDLALVKDAKAGAGVGDAVFAAETADVGVVATNTVGQGIIAEAIGGRGVGMIGRHNLAFSP